MKPFYSNPKDALIFVTILLSLFSVLQLITSYPNNIQASSNETGVINTGDSSPSVTLTPTISIGPTSPITPTFTPTSTPSPTPTPDITAPSVTITNPADGGTVPKNSTITITADATDNVGVTRVDFFVNNVLLCQDTGAPYSCQWNVPKKPNITYTLKATAFDVAGNSATDTNIVTSR